MYALDYDYLGRLDKAAGIAALLLGVIISLAGDGTTLAQRYKIFVQLVMLEYAGLIEILGAADLEG